jgi:hypothetical protein
MKNQTRSSLQATKITKRNAKNSGKIQRKNTSKKSRQAAQGKHDSLAQCDKTQRQLQMKQKGFKP